MLINMHHAAADPDIVANGVRRSVRSTVCPLQGHRWPIAVNPEATDSQKQQGKDGGLKRVDFLIRQELTAHYNALKLAEACAQNAPSTRNIDFFKWF